MKMPLLFIINLMIFTCFISNPELNAQKKIHTYYVDSIPDWPVVRDEAKPATRWWWLGSAVEPKELTILLKEYADKGLGGVEITPIYGVQGQSDKNLLYMSEEWIEVFRHTKSEAEKNGIKTEMNGGTGWPFGGPSVTANNSAARLILSDTLIKEGTVFDAQIQIKDKRQQSTAILERCMAYSSNGKILDLTNQVSDNNHLFWIAPEGGPWQIISIFCGRTFQQVKRAAPGGEGLVMDHFSENAVKNYLSRFDTLFSRYETPWPDGFFSDSYEVYNADWTPGFLDKFIELRGYDLAMYMPLFINSANGDSSVRDRIIADYRETISDLLLKNYVQLWTGWANKKGATTRLQAHGSPGNLIDLYAAADIPECESFGMSGFDITGLRKDSYTRPNDSDLSMLKYASSAAHITGKQFVSSETFTWLTEHFRTSLSQCKPELDLLFASGVNHVFFHGTPYSPTWAEWPGWLFYASVNMSPSNTIWRDIRPFFEYITRCQSFLQYGKPDNDILVYLPVFDMWHDNTKSHYIAFDIHSMPKKAPEFINTVNSLIKSGYDVDYISDKFLSGTSVNNGMFVTPGGVKYKALLLPSVKKIRPETMALITEWIKQGASVIFTDNYPNDVPGYNNLETKQDSLHTLLKELPSYAEFDKWNIYNVGRGKVFTGPSGTSLPDNCGIIGEYFKSEWGMLGIRRVHDNGFLYFVSNIKPSDKEGWMPLSTTAKAAIIFDPLSGDKGKAKIRNNNGITEVFINLKSGQSVFIKTFNNNIANEKPWIYKTAAGPALTLKEGWKMKFINSTPEINEEFQLKDGTLDWTKLPGSAVKTNMGTARYSVRFILPKKTNAKYWLLDLGDVRESARVIVNGHEAGTLWSVPYLINVEKWLQKGENLIEIDVTNLPANRISEMDRQGVKWRIFEEINIVDINYKNTSYAEWEPVPSGLVGPVKLIPQKQQ